MYIVRHVTCPSFLSVFKEASIFPTEFRKVSNINFHENPASESLYQISKDIGWMSQNTTLYYGVRCHRV